MTSPGTSMTYPQHARAIAVLGLPLIGGHLGQVAIGVTDTAMMGRYGITELAALTVSGSLFFVIFLMGSGFAWAVMPMVAAHHAEGDDVSIRRATRMGLWLGIAFGACAMPLMIWSEPLLRAQGQTEAVARLGAEYLRIAGWGLFPALVVMTLKSYLAALERTQIVFWITCAGAVVNGLGNYALIFGNWGAPELGMTGAALASVATQVVMLAGIIAYTQKVLPQHDIFARIWRVDPEMLARVFRLGWPIGLTTLSETGLFAATASMMGNLGEVPLAAHGIALQLASITFMVHMGLSNVATIRVGNAMARKDIDHLVCGAQTVIWMSVAMALFTIVLFVSLPEPLIRLFLSEDNTEQTAIISIGVVLLALAALFQLVDGAQVVALGLLRGMQDTQVPMILAAVSYWLVGIPCSYGLGFVLGWEAPGIWLGLVVGLACAGVALMIRFWRISIPELRNNFAAAEPASARSSS